MRRFKPHRSLPLTAVVLCLALATSAAWAYGPTPPPKPAAAAAAPPSVKQPRVDINSASIEQLKTLPGIGDAEAARIIAARPYPSKAKLVAENVMSFETYTTLKHRIIARQKLPPKAPKSTRNTDAKVEGKPTGPP